MLRGREREGMRNDSRSSGSDKGFLAEITLSGAEPRIRRLEKSGFYMKQPPIVAKDYRSEEHALGSASYGTSSTSSSPRSF
jgi:hypothetical protein